MKKSFLVLVLALLPAWLISAGLSGVIGADAPITVRVNPEGTVVSFKSPDGKVRFRADEYGGPRWMVEDDRGVRPLKLEPSDDPASFTGESEGVVFGLSYSVTEESLVIRAFAENRSAADFAPIRAGLRLGIDTFMSEWPDWDHQMFPTLLRCEKTHFWGYAMSPLGKILLITSPDPVASYHLDYNTIRSSGGHRIYTMELDLLNTGPLPERHPQHQDRLKPGERRQWTVNLTPLADLKQVKPTAARLTQAPMIGLDRYTVAKGESATMTVWGADGTLDEIKGPDGTGVDLEMIRLAEDRSTFTFTPTGPAGVYTITVKNASGKQSEARLYLRRPWSYYLEQARVEALAAPQKASTHTESWYGLYSLFLARRYFPDADLDARAEADFRDIFDTLYNGRTGKPRIKPLQLVDSISARERIQNTAAMVGVLVDLYEANHDPEDLKRAGRLADFLISHQGDDGAYRSLGQHYTSVIYPAKSMLELAGAEKRAAVADPAWRASYERHYDSARRAIDDLKARLDNIGTEGEQTFEDGMISCTATQLAYFALLQDDPAERAKYADAAAKVMNKHRCLRQLQIPDCRMHGATLRFWESQYDVLMKPNMMDSPHGWTSWKTYGTWYLYLLTGDEAYLRETMDTLGAAMQMIDLQSGELRWAFVPDPFIRADAFVPDPEHPGQGKREDVVIGEQYVPMISRWWTCPPDKMTGGFWGQGGACDNDVHEHFKCLAEVALTSAYVILRADGTVGAYNCQVRHEGDALVVEPYEAVVDQVHLNLGDHPTRVRVVFGGGKVVERIFKGMIWVSKQGKIKALPVKR